MATIAPMDCITIYTLLIRVWGEMEQSHGYKPTMAFVAVGNTLTVLIGCLYNCVFWFISHGLGKCGAWLNEGLTTSYVMVYCIDLLACVLFGLAKAVTYCVEAKL